ncbi:hypothetical protein BGZ94_009433 [Podila epigama]|nr:hypothetical protein BGZ94_009433 [Podila epigama]
MVRHSRPSHICSQTKAYHHHESLTSKDLNLYQRPTHVCSQTKHYRRASLLHKSLSSTCTKSVSNNSTVPFAASVQVAVTVTPTLKDTVPAAFVTEKKSCPVQPRHVCSETKAHLKNHLIIGTEDRPPCAFSSVCPPAYTTIDSTAAPAAEATPFTSWPSEKEKVQKEMHSIYDLAPASVPVLMTDSFLPEYSKSAKDMSDGLPLYHPTGQKTTARSPISTIAVQYLKGVLVVVCLAVTWYGQAAFQSQSN